MEFAQEDPELPSLFKAEPAPSVNTYIPHTAQMTPEDRALGCGVLISSANEKDLSIRNLFDFDKGNCRRKYSQYKERTTCQRRLSSRQLWSRAIIQVMLTGLLET